MKRLILFGFVLCASIVLGQDRSNQPLTNDVLIAENGMRMALCDNYYDTTNIQTMLNVKELKADRDLCLVLHGAKSVMFLRTNFLAFELKNTNGISVPKTDKGKAMNIAPKSLTNPNTAIRIGAGFLDFPKMIDLFHSHPVAG